MPERNTPSIINSGLLIIVVGLMGWNVKTTHDLAVDSAVQRGAIQLQLQSLDGKVEAALKNRWTAAFQKIWGDELQKRNANLNVPDPKDIIKAYEQ